MEIDFSELPEGRNRRRLTILQAVGWFFVMLIIIPLVAYFIDEELAAAIIAFELLGLYLLFPAVGILLLNFSSFSFSRQSRLFSQRSKREAALAEVFAEQNHLVWGKQAAPEPKLEPGSLFQFGTNHRCDNAAAGEFMDLPYAIYQHEYFFGPGDSQGWRFENTVMAFTLPRTVPHFIIDSRLYSKGNIQSGLPLLFGRDQEIELEGDFSQYFRLYAPAKYPVPALALLTPDVMLAIMESGMECDIEIIGNKVYFYWPYMESTAENYRAYYRVAEAFLREAKKKLLTGDIYADKEQAQLHSSSSPMSGVRLKPRLLARLDQKYSSYLAVVIVGLLILIYVGFTIDNTFLEQTTMVIIWGIVAIIGVLIPVAYVVALRNALVQQRGIRLARKLRKSYPRHSSRS